MVAAVTYAVERNTKMRGHLSAGWGLRTGLFVALIGCVGACQKAPPVPSLPTNFNDRPNLATTFQQKEKDTHLISGVLEFLAREGKLEGLRKMAPQWWQQFSPLSQRSLSRLVYDQVYMMAGQSDGLMTLLADATQCHFFSRLLNLVRESVTPENRLLFSEILSQASIVPGFATVMSRVIPLLRPSVWDGFQNVTFPKMHVTESDLLGVLHDLSLSLFQTSSLYRELGPVTALQFSPPAFVANFSWLSAFQNKYGNAGWDKLEARWQDPGFLDALPQALRFLDWSERKLGSYLKTAMASSNDGLRREEVDRPASLIPKVLEPLVARAVGYKAGLVLKEKKDAFGSTPAKTLSHLLEYYESLEGPLPRIAGPAACLRARRAAFVSLAVTQRLYTLSQAKGAASPAEQLNLDELDARRRPRFLSLLQEWGQEDLGQFLKTCFERRFAASAQVIFWKERPKLKSVHGESLLMSSLFEEINRSEKVLSPTVYSMLVPWILGTGQWESPTDSFDVMARAHEGLRAVKSATLEAWLPFLQKQRDLAQNEWHPKELAEALAEDAPDVQREWEQALQDLPHLFTVVLGQESRGPTLLSLYHSWVTYQVKNAYEHPASRWTSFWLQSHLLSSSEGNLSQPRYPSTYRLLVTDMGLLGAGRFLASLNPTVWRPLIQPVGQFFYPAANLGFLEPLFSQKGAPVIVPVLGHVLYQGWTFLQPMISPLYHFIQLSQAQNYGPDLYRLWTDFLSAKQLSALRSFLRQQLGPERLKLVARLVSASHDPNLKRAGNILLQSLETHELVALVDLLCLVRGIDDNSVF